MKAAKFVLLVAAIFFCSLFVQARRDPEKKGVYSAGWKDGEWQNPDTCWQISTHGRGSCESQCRKRHFEGGHCAGPFWTQCWCTN